MTGQVYLIGAGPGDPELLTLRALRLLQSADVVVHDRLVSDEIMACVPARTRRVAVGKSAGFHPVPQENINQILVDLGRAGLTVARLKGGDPTIFGRGGEEYDALMAAGIPCDYVPGITAAQGAAASLRLPLTHRGLATGLRYVTGHRARDAELDLDWASLADPQTTLAVYMGAANMVEIARELIAHGMPADLPVMATALRDHSLPAPLLFLIGHVAALAQEDRPPLSGPMPASMPALDAPPICKLVSHG